MPPYADPNSGARYLPGYQRRVIGTSGNTNPNTSGFQDLRVSTQRFWDQVNQFGKGVVTLADSYAKIREERDVRDTETLIDTTLRDRKMDVFASRTGKRADGVLDDEAEWQLKAREEIIKQSGLSANTAGALWDSKAQNYLDRVGAFMLEQNKVAEAESRFAAMVNAQSDLVQSPVGDFKAYALYSAKMNDVYNNSKPDAIKAKEDGISLLLDSWVEQNPDAAKNWFNNNRDALREVLGREFPNAAKVMDRVETRLETQLRKAELQAQRDERLREQEQKRMDRQWQSEAITKILGDEPIDIRDVYREGAAQGISGNTLLTVQKVFESRENISVKDSSTGIRSVYQGRATTEGLSDEEIQALTEHMANGRIIPADYQAIINANDRTRAAEVGGIKDVRKLAVQHLRTAIAPRGAFDSVNQATENRFELAVAALDQHLSQLPTVKEKQKALDILDENSYVMRLIASVAGGITPLDRMREAYNTDAFDPSVQITLPEDEVVLPESMKRLPGETTAAWRARTGR